MIKYSVTQDLVPKLALALFPHTQPFWRYEFNLIDLKRLIGDVSLTASSRCGGQLQ